MKYLFFFIMMVVSVQSEAQKEIIIKNNSFESFLNSYSYSNPFSNISFWRNLASEEYSGPDVFGLWNMWTVTVEPYDKKYCIGLVTRPDGTYEIIGQRLTTPLKANFEYRLEIYVCQSETYKSPVASDPNKIIDFTNATIIMILGGN